MSNEWPDGAGGGRRSTDHVRSFCDAAPSACRVVEGTGGRRGDADAPWGVLTDAIIIPCMQIPPQGRGLVYESAWFTNSAITWFTLFKVSNQFQDHRISVTSVAPVTSVTPTDHL